MDTVSGASSPSSLHPLLWIAGISVTALSFVGIASLLGYLPAKTAAEHPAAVAAAPAPAAAAPAVSPAPAAPSATAAQPAAAPPPLASGVPPDYVPPPVAAPAPPPCADCGVVANVRQVTHEGQGTGAGAIIGGLAGGALANNIGRGDTRTLATIAGAVGGGILGNSIEKSQRKTVGYQVSVSMEDGTSRTVESATMPSWRIGDKVRVVGGTIVAH